MSYKPGYHVMQIGISPEDHAVLQRIMDQRGHSIPDLMHIAIELLVAQVERENETNITNYRERRIAP